MPASLSAFSEPSSRASSIFDYSPSLAETASSEQVTAPTTPIPRRIGSEASRSGSIHLPLRLPDSPRPLEHPNLDSLVVDDALRGLPIGMVVQKLRAAGPSLLQAASATTLHLPAGSGALPSYITCTPPADPATGARIYDPLKHPTHVLAVHAADSDGGRTLLLPVHGLLLAASSRLLSILSSSPELQPSWPHHPNLPSKSRPLVEEGLVALPCVPLTVPSSRVFPLLYSWTYLKSKQLLLSGLLPTPPDNHLDPLLQPSAQTLTAALSHLDSLTLFQHTQRIHQLWQAVVSLEIKDEDLWDTMRAAWSVIMTAVTIKQKRGQKLLQERERDLASMRTVTL